jgi:endonuclease/exonuclease/phosphatase family metal-dependent hydrolase
MIRNRKSASQKLSALSFFIVTSALCGCAGCSGNDVPRKALPNNTVSFMFYNVENLFDMVDNGIEYEEFCPGKCNWERDVFLKKVDNISNAVAAAGPDMAAVCEIENLNSLKELRESLKLKKCRFDYAAIADTPAGSSTCTAILSAYPILNQKSHVVRLQDSANTRNILDVDISIGTCTLKVFVVHWPSQHNDESTRVAAANTLLAILRQLPNGTDYIIAGDFNISYEPYRQSSTSGSPDINGLHHIMKTVIRDTETSERLITVGDLQQYHDSMFHYDPWPEVPAYRRYSYIFRNSSQTPDHILVPASMFDGAGIDYVKGSFCAFRWNGKLIFNGKPYRWQIDHSKRGKYHAGYGYSDHLPVMAKLKVN